MEYQDVRYTAEHPNAIITIDRPQRLNAFRGRTVEELIHAFQRAWTDPEVRCAILTGAGERAFCVGGDQKEYVEHGSYGICESCGNPIGKMRVMAFPRATLCLTCKQREERR